jgi:hypothetical protein
MIYQKKSTARNQRKRKNLLKKQRKKRKKQINLRQIMTQTKQIAIPMIRIKGVKELLSERKRKGTSLLLQNSYFLSFRIHFVCSFELDLIDFVCLFVLWYNEE